MAEQERMCEAVLFASAEPVSVRDLEARMPHGSDVSQALELLRKRYEGRGGRVRGGGVCVSGGRGSPSGPPSPSAGLVGWEGAAAAAVAGAGSIAS